MNRSMAIVLLSCVMGLCAIVLVAVSLMGRDLGVSAWFAQVDGGTALTEVDAGTALAEGMSATERPPEAANATPEATVQPQSTAQLQPTAESAALSDLQSGAATPQTAATATPSAMAEPEQSTVAGVSGLVASVSIPSISAPESFGTPDELDESTPRYSYGALSMETGLDIEVLEKMYSPFYVLDIDMDEVYYPLTSPGGSAGNNKIYGGQVGVEVVSIEGDYAYINAYRYPGGRAMDGYVPVSMLKEVTPDDQYSIIIDKRQQRLFLFEYGELKADMYCSTGKTTTETPAGEFLKYGTKRTIYSDADPDIAYYGIKLNGRVYIHSVSHIDGDYSVSIDMLGRKASHGCIRVPLDWAEWFYNNIPDNTKIVITEYRGDTPPLGEGGRDGD